MKLNWAILLLLIATACVKSNQGGESNIDVRVDSVLSVMTLEEKIGQLNLPSAGAFTTGEAESSDNAGDRRGKKPLENSFVIWNGCDSWL